MLCVSADGGWTGYAADSDYLICVETIECALKLFNAVWGDDAAELAQEIRVDDPVLINEMAQAYMDHPKGRDFGFGGQVVLAFDFGDHTKAVQLRAVPIDANLKAILPETVSKPVAIFADSQNVSFSLRAEALLEYKAKFERPWRNDVAKDRYHPELDESVSIEKKIPVDFVVVVSQKDRSITCKAEFTHEAFFESEILFFEGTFSSGRKVSNELPAMVRRLIGE